jgi:hypothetical protein
MTERDDTPTCGKGLAEHAAVPAKLAELTGALGRVLELHMRALDLGDAASREEYAAYEELSGVYRGIAAELSAVARRMAGYRHLPMGRHDMAAMTAAENVAAFGEYVRAEMELAEVLEKRLRQDRAMMQ